MVTLMKSVREGVSSKVCFVVIIDLRILITEPYLTTSFLCLLVETIGDA
jgi:hypothetical protein